MQVLVPVSTTAAGDWVGYPSGDPHAAIDEAARDDNDRAQTDLWPSGDQPLIVKLTTPTQPIRAGAKVKYAIGTTRDPKTVWVRLYCGAVQIVEWPHANITTLGEFSQTLNAGHAAAINACVDPYDLYLHFMGGGGVAHNVGIAERLRARDVPSAEEESIFYMPPEATLTDSGALVWDILPSTSLINSLAPAIAVAGPVDLAMLYSGEVFWRMTAQQKWQFTYKGWLEGFSFAQWMAAGDGAYHSRGGWLFGSAVTTDPDPADIFLQADLEFQGPSNTPNIWDLDLTDGDAINTIAGYDVTNGYPVTGWPNPYGRYFGVDPTYGFNYMRFSNDPDPQAQNGQLTYPLAPDTKEGVMLCSWFLRLGSGARGTTENDRNEAYLGYALYIEGDVAAAFGEYGMKLPGLVNSDGTGLDSLSFRMWHHIPIQGTFGLRTYWYDYTRPLYGEPQDDLLIRLKPNRWYWIEQRIKLNSSTGVADGIQQVWLNGHMVLDIQGVIIKDGLTPPVLRGAHINVYHGGLYNPVGPMHYRLAMIRTSTSYIGVPTEFLPNFPFWRPAVGERANRGATIQYDYRPPEADSGGSLHGVSGLASAKWYSGGTFAQDLGTWGSVIKGGAGHSAYYGNEIYRGDLALGWSRITNPQTTLFVEQTALTHAQIDQIVGFGATANGELWADSSCTTTLQDQPGAFQWYCGPVVLPPGLGGAGSNGALLTPFRDAMTPNAGKGLMSHILQLHDPAAGWERYSNNNFPGLAIYGNTSVVVPAHNKVLVFNTQIKALNLSTRLWSTLNADGPATFASSTGAGYSASRDIVMVLNHAHTVAASSFVVVNPATGSYSSPGTTGTGPPHETLGIIGSGVWVEEHGCLYFYQHETEPNKLYRLTPPGSNPATNPWTWSSQTLSGDTPQNDPNTAQFTSLFWSESAQVLVWYGGPLYPLQVWTPQ